MSFLSLFFTERSVATVSHNYNIQAIVEAISEMISDTNSHYSSWKCTKKH